MLNDATANDWERIFTGSVLFAKWPSFRNDLQFRVDAVPIAVGRPIFSPGDAPRYLFLVLSGSVIERSLRDHEGLDGPIWLELKHRSGGYFGQHALFTERYDSFAVAAEETLVLRMAAADLRAALERDPDLYEKLLQEKLASRLRRIPLLQALEDWQVRRLTQVIQDKKDLARGARLPLGDEPGVWMMDWGQLAVTGLTSYAGAPDTPWRLSAGNFIISGGAQHMTDVSATLRAGRVHIASGAEALAKTHVFYLPISDADRLVNAFQLVHRMLEEPFDIVSHLQSVAETERVRETFPHRLGDAQTRSADESHRLFSAAGMTPAHLEHLAQFCGWEFIPAEQNITTQGSVGHSFIIMVRGKALVSALDERGRPRPRNMLLSGDYYGETSLLEGKARDATVRAVLGPNQGGAGGRPGTEVITLDRRDLQYAFLERPDLWNPEIPLFRRSIITKEEKLLYPWQAEGETVIWHDRGHWLWAAWPILLLTIATLLIMTVIHFVSSSLSWELVEDLLIGALVIFPIGFIIVLNYLDDYYAVTNRRVTRRDRQIFIYEARVESPIEAIQDITTKIGFWAAVFDFGDVTVRTADKSSSILFAHVPQPDRVQKLISDVRAEALTAQRGLRSETLRRGLMTGLDLSLMIPERVRALGGDAVFSRTPRWIDRFLAWLRGAQSGGVQLPSRKSGPPGWLLDLGKKLPPRWQKALKLEAAPAPKPLSAETTHVWRKHWLNLLRRAGPPALTMSLMLAILVLGLRNLSWLQMSFGLRPLAFFGVSGVLLPVVGFWLWWEWADYHNDVYVVTEEKLIDIQKRPLALSAEQREGNLDRVQTVDTKQKTLWANLFNYGDVVIRTAAADEGYDFLMVPNPRLVQAIIFQRVGAVRRKQEEQQAAKQQQALVEGIQVYHQLREAQSAAEAQTVRS